MKVQFEESQALAGVYHAMLGDRIVGLVRREGRRWQATVYRANGEDYQASMSQRHAAFAFIEGNVAAPSEART
jgi:hypothetical protein